MKHLSPKEAHDFLLKHPDAVFIDCRSEFEFLFVGHGVAVSVDAEVARVFEVGGSDHTDPVGCRS